MYRSTIKLPYIFLLLVALLPQISLSGYVTVTNNGKAALQAYFVPAELVGETDLNDRSTFRTISGGASVHSFPVTLESIKSSHAETVTISDAPQILKHEFTGPHYVVFLTDSELKEDFLESACYVTSTTEVIVYREGICNCKGLSCEQRTLRIVEKLKVSSNKSKDGSKGCNVM